MVYRRGTIEVGCLAVWLIERGGVMVICGVCFPMPVRDWRGVASQARDCSV